jgi:hypothetical protein
MAEESKTIAMQPLPGPVRREEIALYAYCIWDTEGRPERRALEHWLQAELQLRTAGV